MNSLKNIFTAIIFTSFISSAFADNTVSLSRGESIRQDSANYYRIAYGFGIADNLSTNKHVDIEAYIDAAVSIWDHTDDVVAISISPVLRITTPQDGTSFRPFLDISVAGPTYISKTTFVEQNLDQHLQFENRISLGVERGNVGFSINAYHYSNASFGEENDGTDWVVGTFTIRY